MITVDRVNLLDLAAISTLDDRTTKNIYLSIDYILQKRHFLNKDKFGIFTRINTMSENEINTLLWGYSDFNFNLSLEEKRQLVLKAILSRSTRGTVGILKEVCKLLYSGFEIEEWNSYQGQAGRFKIHTDKKLNVSEYKRLIEVVNQNKNVRSHLDFVELHQVNSSTYFVSGYKDMKILTVKEKRKKDFTVLNNFNLKAYKQIIGEVNRNEI